MNVRTQKFFILGISKSGYSAAEYILKQGGKCFFYEELISDKISESEEKLKRLGGIKIMEDGVNLVLSEIDVLIISPGIPINHDISVKAKRMGKKIVGELEFAFLQYNPLCVAITGTNGKTTTVNMLGNILSKGDNDYKLVGNIGVPVSSELENTNKNSLLITEVSSFQLESVHSFCPHVACLLNISPDHLERHYSMENYTFLKKRIFANMTKSEYAVLNYDDLTVRAIAPELKCNVVWVSITDNETDACLINGGLYYKGEFILNASELPVKGEHNVYNALFAMACAFLIGESKENVINGLKTFRGVRHRIELVAEKNGIKFYDDSKSTNTASSITAIECMNQPTVLILGGSEKGENYTELFKKIKNSDVKHTVITGASRLNMLESAGLIGCGNLTVTDDFNDAVRFACLLADEGECVLLSPACASFDNFKNYEERGDAFSKIVESFS